MSGPGKVAKGAQIDIGGMLRRNQAAEDEPVFQQPSYDDYKGYFKCVEGAAKFLRRLEMKYARMPQSRLATLKARKGLERKWHLDALKGLKFDTREDIYDPVTEQISLWKYRYIKEATKKGEKNQVRYVLVRKSDGKYLVQEVTGMKGGKEVVKNVEGAAGKISKRNLKHMLCPTPKVKTGIDEHDPFDMNNEDSEFEDDF